MDNLGKFIVLEGIEGAGKSTAINTITTVLKQNNIHDIVFTREPGGTPLAEKLRALIKHHDSDEYITDKAELLMLYAARIQLVTNVIKPALARGAWVIGDRHDMSSQAYQGGGRQMDSHLLQTLKTSILGDFEPDLTLYMDIEPELGLARARGRGALDRIEQQHIDFFRRTRQKYQELVAATPNCITINAANNLETVSADIRTNMQNWLANII